MKYDKGGSEARVEMVAGLLVLDADAVEVTEVVAHTYSLRSGVRCYWVFGE